MAKQPPISKPWRILFPGKLYKQLHDHLFSGDNDEHAAVVLAGIAETVSDIRLLAHSLYLAMDRQDFVPGQHSYRTLRPEFVTEKIWQARKEGLVYLAVHNHRGNNSVDFSDIDLRSHERGYPALLNINRGRPVGALVFAKNAVAGDIWLSGNQRTRLTNGIVVGPSRKTLTARPFSPSQRRHSRYDRQVRLFGDRGQDILGEAKVAIIGLGGIGSLLSEYLGRLGVGRFVLIDPDRVETSNLCRLVGAKRWDDGSWLIGSKRFPWLQKKVARRKVSIAKRNIKRANRNARVEKLPSDFFDPEVARRMTDCDYMFLAADTTRARLLFNAIVHQYLIPGSQAGAKIRCRSEDGKILGVHAVARPVHPESGCLYCNQLINGARLTEEIRSPEECQVRQYVNEPEIVAPSVITLNALASAQAANDFMFYMTGLTLPEAFSGYVRFEPLSRKISPDRTRTDADCCHCGQSRSSCFARGDMSELPGF